MRRVSVRRSLIAVMIAIFAVPVVGVSPADAYFVCFTGRDSIDPLIYDVTFEPLGYEAPKGLFDLFGQPDVAQGVRFSATGDDRRHHLHESGVPSGVASGRLIVVDADTGTERVSRDLDFADGRGGGYKETLTTDLGPLDVATPDEGVAAYDVTVEVTDVCGNTGVLTERYFHAAPALWGSCNEYSPEAVCP